ncbi:hypothetical protein D3C80_1207310 [compost metagenome]
MGIGAAVVTFGAKHGQAITQRVAQLQPLQGFAALSDLVQLVFLATGPQPGADVFRQDNDGLGVDQALGAGMFKVGGQLAMQALQALVVTGEQLRLDAQQVAVIGRHAFAQGQLDAQVRQVVPGRALFGPEPVATQGGNDNQRQGAQQKFSHETQ